MNFAASIEDRHQEIDFGRTWIYKKRSLHVMKSVPAEGGHTKNAVGRTAGIAWILGWQRPDR